MANPKTQVEQVTCITYYIFRTEKLESFGYAEINTMFDKLHITDPTNLTLVVTRCLKQGYLKETRDSKNGQKSLAITRTGMAYVESLLKGKADGKK